MLAGFVYNILFTPSLGMFIKTENSGMVNLQYSILLLWFKSTIQNIGILPAELSGPVSQVSPQPRGLGLIRGTNVATSFPRRLQFPSVPRRQYLVPRPVMAGIFQCLEYSSTDTPPLFSRVTHGSQGYQTHHLTSIQLRLGPREGHAQAYLYWTV